MNCSPKLLKWIIIFVIFACYAYADSPLIGCVKWRLIGPFRGGRSVAVSGVPGSGANFYFGAVDGGIWKSENAGATWQPTFDGQAVASIGALEVAPSNAKVIYAGSGESDIRSNLASGDGVYKSTDAGATWHNIGLKDTRQISRIVVDAKNSDHVLVAALGHAYAPNKMRGVFVSDNGGATWTQSLFKGEAIGAADLAMATDQPNVVVAAMWEAHRPPWSTYAPIGGPGCGLYLSEDGGHNWSALKGLPEHPGRMGVAIARGTDAQRIYVTVDAGQASGLYRSDDRGKSWKRVNSDSRITSRAWYFSSVTVDPNDADIVYIPNVSLYKLSNGGEKLSIVRGAPGGDDYHQLWIDPANSTRMALASDQGTVVSIDGGNTWSSWYNQPTAQLYHVITDNAYPFSVYAAQQDSGSVSVPSRTDHRQIDNTDLSNIGGTESGYVAPDPKDPNVFFVTGTFGTVDRFDRRTHQSQNIAPWPAPNGLGSPSERKYRDPWTPVLVFSPLQKNALYLGTQYIMRTMDAGMTWQTISPDLTGANSLAEKDKSGVTVDNAIQRGYGVVYSIAPSPLIAEQIWAGTDTGLVHLSRNNGKSWSNVTPSDLTPWSKVSQIEASHYSAGEAFLAVDRHRLDDMQPHAYRTRDFGKTWRSITNGIGEHDFIRVIREDPKRKGLLFAGTEFGIYMSLDDGDNWRSLQLNLPVTSVPDLVVHGDDLVLATHGRSFWIMDDISPLRQMDATSQMHATTQTSRLFAPASAIRSISDGFVGTPLPVDEPQATNPARGAYIDYVIGAGASPDVQLDIRDALGKLVRHISASDKVEEPETNVPIAPRWLQKKQVLSGAPGMHRFVWDLRFGRSGNESMDDDDSQIADYSGPFVLPGIYKLRLTVEDDHFEQSLRVTQDPRSAATTSDVQQQFSWAKRAFESAVTASRLSAEVAAQQKATKGMESFQKELAMVTHNFSSALAAIESSDRRPTSQSVEFLRQSEASFHTLQKHWNELQKAHESGTGRSAGSGLKTAQ